MLLVWKRKFFFLMKREVNCISVFFQNTIKIVIFYWHEIQIILDVEDTEYIDGQ